MRLVQGVVALTALLYAFESSAGLEEDCLVYDTTGQGAMQARQSGVALADAMKIINKPAKFTDPVDTRNHKIAMTAMKVSFVEAYKTPRYMTEKMQKDAISDFRNRMYSECLSFRADEVKPLD